MLWKGWEWTEPNSPAAFQVVIVMLQLGSGSQRSTSPGVGTPTAGEEGDEGQEEEEEVDEVEDEEVEELGEEEEELEFGMHVAVAAASVFHATNWLPIRSMVSEEKPTASRFARLRCSL
jgi:hypothetical protein